MTGSLPRASSRHLLTKANRLWRDRFCLRALYFIPNAVQAALANAIRGPGGLVTIPPFLNSYESWPVAKALSQDHGIDLKTRLDAECVAAITCARLNPSNQRTHFPSSWIDWICQTRNWFTTYRLMRLCSTHMPHRPGCASYHIRGPKGAHHKTNPREGTDRGLDELRISESSSVFSQNMG